MAGLLVAGPAVADPPVQMLTSTFDSFSHWFFVWQTTVEIEILIIAALFFIYRPYLPFVVSRIWTHLPVVGIMNRVRNIAPFGGFSLRNGMYRKEWKNNIMYYIKKYLGSYFFMGVPFDIVHIDRGFVQDPVMNKYIVTLNTLGYKTIQDLENALTFNGIDKDGADTLDIVGRMGFDSYESARDNLNPSNLANTSMIYAPKYSNIPLDSLLGYGADISPGSIAAQVDDIFEYRKPPLEEDNLTKWMPVIIFLFVVTICAAILITQVR